MGRGVGKTEVEAGGVKETLTESEMERFGAAVVQSTTTSVSESGRGLGGGFMRCAGVGEVRTGSRWFWLELGYLVSCWRDVQGETVPIYSLRISLGHIHHRTTIPVSVPSCV